MKPAPFTYHRPSSLAEALALLAEHGDDAKVLAGGQSLVPLMALRMARPAHVVDLARVPDLDAITVDDGASVTIGAMVRHATVEHSDDVATAAPLVHAAMPWIGHRAIRSRGTTVGSIAHGDSSAEMPAVVLATGATMTAASVRGERTIAAADFFAGYLQTALASDEVLTAVTFPAWSASAGGSVVEVARRHGDYALVGLACRLELDGDMIVDAALAFFGVAATPVRVDDAERALVGASATADTFAEAAAVVSASLTPPADLHATAAYRRHVAGVLTRRGLSAATIQIGAHA